MRLGTPPGFVCYHRHSSCYTVYFFFFNDTATTEIYTLSLHDALPISGSRPQDPRQPGRLRSGQGVPLSRRSASSRGDRKSTRLNSSHTVISYAVFCLKKKTTPIV